MHETQTLARFAADLRLESVPSDVVAFARRLILDTVGVALGCARLPWSLAVYQPITALGGRPDATIVVHGDRVSVDNAAFANACFAHGFELDDVHSQAMTHPGVVVIPAALAVAEREGADGRACLGAVLAGYEVMLRIAWSVSPHLLARGHHSPPAAGPFGAAVAAGRLLGLDAAGLHSALGIASSHAAGLMEYTQGGGSVKRLHAGIPAHAGIRSALFAQAGITAPPAALEGVRGFCRVFVDECDLSRLTRDLGTLWLTPGTTMKAYSCNASIHPAIDALSELLRNHALQGGNLANVEVGVSKDHVVRVGAIREPQDVLGMQFSLPFSLALTTLRGGNGPAQYREENLRAPDLLDFARRVHVYEDAEAEKLRGHRYTAVVTVTTRSGASFSQRVTAAKGTPDRPLSVEEIHAKFRDLAGLNLPSPRVEELIARFEALDEEPNVAALMARTRAG